MKKQLPLKPIGMQKDRVRVILALGVLAVTSSSFIIRYATQPPYALAFVRVMMTGIIAFFLLNREYTIKSENMEISHIGLIIIAGIGLATHFGWWFESLDYIAIGTSLSLTNTAPVWMAILGFIIYRKGLKSRQYISIILVIAGSIILFTNQGKLGEEATRGLFLALGSAVGFAIYLLVARQLVPVFGIWKYFGMVNIVTALVLLPWIWLNGQISALGSGNIWFFGILLAIVPGTLGHAVYNWSMPKLDPVDVGVATLGEPILGTIVAWIFLGEILNNAQIFGILALIGAIFFTLDFKSSTKENFSINESLN